VKHSLPQEIKLGSPISLPFDQLEAGHLALDLALAPRQGQSRLNGSLVLRGRFLCDLQVSAPAVPFLYGFKPGREGKKPLVHHQPTF